MGMEPDAQSATVSGFLLLHLECALVPLTQDTLEIPSCVINWAMSEPWRAAVVPACYLCDSEGCAEELPKE